MLGNNKRQRQLSLGIVVALSLLTITVVAALFLPYGVDWRLAIRPGCLAMLNGKSPFETVPYFGFAPWALIPLLPLALLPENIGRAILFLISITAQGSQKTG